MVRVQVQFTEEQLRRLRAEAHRRDISVAEMVRSCVARGLKSEEDDLDVRYERAIAFVGSVRDPDGTTDVSSKHDTYLERAME